MIGENNSFFLPVRAKLMTIAAVFKSCREKKNLKLSEQ